MDAWTQIYYPQSPRFPGGPNTVFLNRDFSQVPAVDKTGSINSGCAFFEFLVHIV